MPLSQETIPMVGHAFEARIYAENPRNNFLPDSGTLLYLSTPEPTHIFAPTYPSQTRTATSSDYTALGASESSDPSLQLTPSLRVEQGFTQGALIGVFYDPMIAKVVVHGRDRTEALRILRKALDEYHVVGVSTNVEFLRRLAGNKDFIDAKVETGFIPVSSLAEFRTNHSILTETPPRIIPTCTRTKCKCHRTGHPFLRHTRATECNFACCVVDHTLGFPDITSVRRGYV